jgi:hypothetical protein
VTRQHRAFTALGALGLSVALFTATALGADPASAPPPSATAATVATSSIQKVPTPPVVVAPGTPLQVELAANVDSKVARVGDRIEGRLAQDLAVGERRAALAGAPVSGKVTGLVAGGPGGDGASTLELTFDSLQAANGATIPIVARYHHPADATAPSSVGVEPKLRAGTVITVPTETTFSIY